MNSITYIISICAFALMNVFTLILMQVERHKSSEREMRLVKALIAQNVFELKSAEESPADVHKRMKIENDLAVKAEKLETTRRGNDIYDRVPVK